MKHLLPRSILLIALLEICVLRLTLPAQVPVSAVRGTVTDVTGAPIARAKVTLREEQTALVRTAISQADGQYLVEALAPGKYEIAVAAPSFATTVEVQTLQVGDNRTLNFALRPGLVRELIQVNG